MKYLAPISSTEDLERLLRAFREAGGYQQFVVADEEGNEFSLLDVESPGNHRPLVLRIRPGRPEGSQ